MEDNQLKACPFCHSKPVLIEDIWVCCEKCNIEVPIDDWQGRPQANTEADEMERIKNAIINATMQDGDSFAVHLAESPVVDMNTDTLVESMLAIDEIGVILAKAVIAALPPKADKPQADNRLKIATDALQFYAEIRNYDFNPLPEYKSIDDVGVVTSNIETDEGDTARTALSQIQQEKL